MSNRWLILAVLFLARSTMAFQFQSVAALAQFVVTGLAIDYARLGLLIGFYLLPGIAIAYPGGLLGQRFGDKRVVLVGMALMVVGGALTVGVDSYASFLVGRLISGTGAVLINVLLMKMATDWFAGREMATSLALLVSSWPVGIGLALIVLPRLATATSAATALAMTAAAIALVLALVAAVYRAPATAAATPPRVGGLAFGLSLRESGMVSLAGGIWALFNVGYIILVSFAPSLLIARGASAGEAGFATSLASSAIIPTIALGGVLLDRVGHATGLMVTVFAVLGLSIALVPMAPSPWLFAFVGAVGGLPAGAMLVLPTEVLRPQNRGPGMGIFYTWYYVAMALLTPAAGLVRDLSSDPGAPLLFAGALEIATIAILAVLRWQQRGDGWRR